MSNPVPLPDSLRKRFYEPIVLFDALKYVYRKNKKISEPDLESETGKSKQQTYFCFLNKLSQICDNQPQQPLGKTVSAIVVLDSGTIEYRFASNQRDGEELDAVKQYLTGILSILGRVRDDEVSSPKSRRLILSRILHKVLAFNRPRVEAYIESLLFEDRLEFCITSASGDGTTDGKSAAAALGRLQPLLNAARSTALSNEDEFAHQAEALLQSINSDYEPFLEEYMKVKTRGDETDSPWSEVRHSIGRLLSYYIAIKVLISARKYWPQLFVLFEVTAIPSSTPHSDAPVIRRSARGILNRMGGPKATVDAHQRHTDTLQPLGLDDRIKQRVKPGHFRPIVHAEVHLLDSVLRDRARAEADGDGPLRFFNEAEFGGYIGSSKPTCLLCRLYFEGHPSGVGCRETHGNLYYNWRAPDVMEGEGEEAAAAARAVLEGMLKKVRAETARAITARSSTRKKHDSWDTPSNPLLSTVAGSTVRGADDMASWLGRVNLDSASTRGWSDDLVSRRGEVDGDDASTRDWTDESMAATPESTPRKAGGRTPESIVNEAGEKIVETTPGRPPQKAPENTTQGTSQTIPKRNPESTGGDSNGRRKRIVVVESEEEDEDEDEDDEDDGGVRLDQV